MATINTDIAKKIDIVIRQDNSATINLSIKDSSNAAFDLTGYGITLKVYDGSDTLLSLDEGAGNGVAIAEPTDGSVVISIRSSQASLLAGSYKYRLVLTYGDSVKTWMYGKFKVNED
tara:strand:- start:3570 stop:3920 length:351 start_codon:yes stop_codon:yes gene_type:complete